LLGFLVFEPLFIRVGYNKKSTTLVVVTDVVLRLGNVKQSLMCPLMLFFYSIIRYWWHDKDSSCMWKRGLPCLVTFVFSLMKFSIEYLMSQRFLLGNMYNLPHKG
jgi:hypothetical protein